MSPSQGPTLSRREREIMDILYRMGKASAADVREAMSDPPSYSAVRAHLRILEEKGHLKHRVDGARYIYSPRRTRGAAARSAMQRVLDTFFENSTERALAALLELNERDLSEDALNRLAKLIERARQEGK